MLPSKTLWVQCYRTAPYKIIVLSDCQLFSMLPDCTIQDNCVVRLSVVLNLPYCTIQDNCVVRLFSMLLDCTIQDNCVVRLSVVLNITRLHHTSLMFCQIFNCSQCYKTAPYKIIVLSDCQLLSMLPDCTIQDNCVVRLSVVLNVTGLRHTR